MSNPTKPTKPFVKPSTMKIEDTTEKDMAMCFLMTTAIVAVIAVAYFINIV